MRKASSLPAHEPGPSSQALAPPADAPLAQAATRVLAAGAPGDPAFRLLPEGETAFNARIAIARRARRSMNLDPRSARTNTELGLVIACGGA